MPMTGTSASIFSPRMTGSRVPSLNSISYPFALGLIPTMIVDSSINLWSATMEVFTLPIFASSAITRSRRLPISSRMPSVFSHDCSTKAEAAAIHKNNLFISD
jgi:hypothetical protein